MEYKEFIQPKEAPVLRPTEEEFKDPIAYISKIRPLGDEYGIVKIRPPAQWKPPFSLDSDQFRFTPRLQPLNELEAKTRVKLNFLDSLAKFWELQGSSLKVPNVERITLDLHLLFKTVVDEGGYVEVSEQKQWSEIGRKLKFQMQSTPASLKYHYEKLLYPYEVFLAKHDKLKIVPERRKVCVVQCKQEPSAPSSTAYSLRTSRRSRLESPDMQDFVPSSNELKKLKFLAPGVKNTAYGTMCMMSRQTVKVERFNINEDSSGDNPSALTVALNGKSSSCVETAPVPNLSPVSLPSPVFEEHKRYLHELEHIENYVCKDCSRGDNENELLICDGCDTCYHTFCLDPPLKTIPSGDWKCPDCIAKECNKPQESFGFEQANKDYTLKTFGEMANRFKENYFNLPPQEVPTTLVEREFWRILGSVDEDVTVEYGADLHSSDHGSGFPTSKTSSSSEAQAYVESGWNLTNLANLPGSVLSYVKTNISGMKVPWLYVGMCFSSFCWHTEDHWIYSINYLHWGEPKTWYGVPPEHAENLERVMMESAPELFESHPDLMHHLVTILSPNILMEHNIPVYRTDQCAGEFVITFPRAYHAGFNQGFNFAEAVNFALADWIVMDKKSISHYRTVKRLVVFSHEELLSGMADVADKLEANILVACYHEMRRCIKKEQEHRQDVCAKFKPACSRVFFNQQPDDQRQCEICLTTVFWSACSCPCQPGKLICLRCMLEHTECNEVGQVFQYCFSMDELHCHLNVLEQRAKRYMEWKASVEEIVGVKLTSDKPSLAMVEQLVKQASCWAQSCSNTMAKLRAILNDAEMCCTVANQILNGAKCKTRHSSSDPTISVEEFAGFVKEVEGLPCIIPQCDELALKLQQVKECQQMMQEELRLCQMALAKSEPKSSLQAVKLLAKACELHIFFPEMQPLKTAVEQLQWFQKAQLVLKPGSHHTNQTHTLEYLSSIMQEGKLLMDSKLVTDTCNSIKHLINIGKKWDQKAQEALEIDPPYPVTYLNTIVKGVSNFGLYLESVELLQKVIDDASVWTKKAEELQRVEKPHISAVEKLLAKKHDLNVELSLPASLDRKYELATQWIQNAANLFLPLTSENTLLEVLLPRCKGNRYTRKRRSSNETKMLSELHGNRELEVQQITTMEMEEWSYITELREKNEKKQNTVPNHHVLYCHCKRQSSGCMIQCDLCLEWYHMSCLDAEKPNQNEKYLCSSCKRSLRPTLASAVVLLGLLPTVPMKLTEATTLECLVNRAAVCQKEAKAALAKAREALAASKKKQEIKLVLQKLNNSPDLTAMLIKSQMSKLSGGAMPACSSAPIAKSTSHLSQTKSSAANSVAGLMTVKPKQVLFTPQHSPAAPALSTIVGALLSANKNANNNEINPLAPSSNLRKELEHIALKCDLLEVTIEESQQLWQLLREDETSTSSSSTCQTPDPPKKRKSSDSSTVLTKKQKALFQDTSDIEPCSAAKCLLPKDSTVDWVQCEACQRWFHFDCVGLTSQDLTAQEEYHCCDCNTVAGAQSSVRQCIPVIGLSSGVK